MTLKLRDVWETARKSAHNLQGVFNLKLDHNRDRKLLDTWITKCLAAKFFAARCNLMLNKNFQTSHWATLASQPQ